MSINDIINTHFEELSSLVKASPIPIYCGNMAEDVLQNCFLAALKKFHGEDLEEENGLRYLKNAILTEIKFSYKRKDRDKLIFVENLIVYDKAEEN